MVGIKDSLWWCIYKPKSIKRDIEIGRIRIEQFGAYWKYLSEFSIKRRFRNKHYGTSLLENVVSYYDYNNLFLLTKIKNARAIHIYEKLGFIQVKTTGKNNRWIIMAMTRDPEGFDFFKDIEYKGF